MPHENNQNLPQLLDPARLANFPAMVDEEKTLLTRAADLHRLGFCEYALLGIWNAAVSNLKRRVEAYGVELWISVVENESGRKKYDKDGETLSERWESVDDLVLVAGATKLGLLNPKAGKALEMINWMRNHASAAHDSDHQAAPDDVVALAILLQRNLFEAAMPDPGHSVSTLFDPIQSTVLEHEEQANLLKDEISALRPQDVRICFAFMLNILCGESEPGITNAQLLFPSIWERANDDLKKTAGIKYHALKFEADPAILAKNKDARDRLLNTLVELKGVKFIPEAARAQLYRRAAKRLGDAKDSPYGWGDENMAAKTLVQFGPHVPAVAFEEVYQEILAVWCGNYWGSSSCDVILAEFIDALSADQIRQVVRMFQTNERVKNELSQVKPNAKAVALLTQLETRLTIEANKDEARRAIEYIREL